MTQHNITEEDEGKTVVDSSGDTIGVVSEVRGGTAYVDPDPGITDKISSALGWGDADAGDQPLDADEVDAITDDEIRIRDDL